MANENGWGDGASNNDIGWGKGADNEIGWGSVYSVSSAGLTDIIGTPAVDPDAQAFITAAAITDPTQQSAINQLVVDLKGYNIWSKMKALYPFVGGTAAQHKWNLKDPRDLDAAFRLVFSGGWTHSVNGALPNGTNGYANTYLNPSTILTVNSAHLSLYSRTQNGNVLDQPMRVVGGSNDFHLSPNINGAGLSFYTSIGGSLAAQATNTDSRGFYIASRILNNSLKGYKNSSVIATNTSSASNLFPNFNVYLGAANSSASPVNYSKLELTFSSIGDGLNDTEAANFYTAVQTFQVTLGRSIGTQTVSDADAQAFVTNAGIVDQVEANAVNNLVIGLKADSLWTKMKAVYPFVGGTSTTNKFNLKNPLDTDAAFRLVFNGGWTFSSNGAISNGTNAYGDTKLNPFTNFGSNYSHQSIYLRNNTNSLVVTGVTDSGNNRFDFGYDVNKVPFHAIASTTSNLGSTDTRTDGFLLSFRTGSTTGKYKRNNVDKITSLPSFSQYPSFNYYIGARNAGGVAALFNNQELSFCSIGDGLTDTEATNLYNRVQTFNTALARQV